MMLISALALAAAIDGQAALRHASSLAALGPHPPGSPRGRFAAEYVAAQFRAAGLGEVRLEPFEEHGVRGTNVIGVLRAGGPDVVVIGAHHDTAPGAPGAYDDGGGVGVVIEAARVLAGEGARPRTLVFASWDAEESWATSSTTTAGSRAYLRSLGPDASHVVAAIAVEMSGFAGGTPTLHPIAYGDPVRPGAYVIAPGWLVAAALSGAAGNGAPVAVGDPLLSWLYQPAVRTFRAGLYGDDLSFLQAGVPALMLSDSSFSRFYPWYHQAEDTADKLDASALARTGQALLGMVGELGRTPRGPAPDRTWFAAFGIVLGGSVVLLVGAASVLPGLLGGVRRGGVYFGARVVQAGLFALLLWRHPVPAVWVFLLPNLLSALWRGLLPGILALLPAAGVVGLGLAASLRGQAGGIWLAPWEVGVALLALALLVPRAGMAKPGRSVRKPKRRGR